MSDNLIKPSGENFKTRNETQAALKVGILYTSATSFSEEAGTIQTKEISIYGFNGATNSLETTTDVRDPKKNIDITNGIFPLLIKYNTTPISEKATITIKEYKLPVFEEGTELDWEEQEVEG